MYQKIVAYQYDEHNDLMAELNCGHNQHIRHKPPFINRVWTTHYKGRLAHIGDTLHCIKCKENAPKDKQLGKII